MPLPNQYAALLNSFRTSGMATFQNSAHDPFTEPSCCGYTYAQLVEMKQKHPELYAEIMHKENSKKWRVW